MAIILPQDCPAYSRLKEQGVPVKSDTGLEFARSTNAAGVLTVGFVNVMPEIYLDETVDLLLSRLSETNRDIRVVFISPENNPAKGASWSREHAKEQGIDAFVITGYAASNLPFDQLSFKNSLGDLLDYADEEGLAVQAYCAGAMFAANHTYGISKEPSPYKLLGNLEYKTADGESVHLATSRLNTLNRQELLSAVKTQGLEILVETQQAPQPEPGILIDRNRNWVLPLAHLEYAYVTRNDYPDFEGQDLNILEYQYKRDHNTNSPKYDQALADRVHPPVNLHLTPAQVKNREDYSVKVLTEWADRALEQKAERKFAAQAQPIVGYENAVGSTVSGPGLHRTFNS